MFENSSAIFCTFLLLLFMFFLYVLRFAIANFFGISFLYLDLYALRDDA